jgi:DNA-binding MarR family transcriptional regulator
MVIVTDAIDRANNEWAEALPDLDISAGSVLARVERLAHLIEQRQNDRLRRRPGMLVSNRGDFDVLRALRRVGPPFRMAPGDIAQRVLVSSAGMSGRLKRLAQEGWIVRVPAPEDGRSMMVELTPEGVADLDADLPQHYAFESSLLDALAPERQADVAAALRLLLLTLEQDSSSR